MSHDHVHNTTDELINAIHEAGKQANKRMSQTHRSREKALQVSREVIRFSANSIRATHRSEFLEARELQGKARMLLNELTYTKKEHPDVFYSGFVEDSQKEYVEACSTLAFAEESALPTMETLNVGPAAYMNGLAETIGELRRFLLDLLRSDNFTRCENLLKIMDEIYSILVTIDYPDAVTRGLRRNTDVMRGVIERTRGDLTVALRQRKLERQLRQLTDRLDDN